MKPSDEIIMFLKEKHHENFKFILENENIDFDNQDCIFKPHELELAIRVIWKFKNKIDELCEVEPKKK